MFQVKNTKSIAMEKYFQNTFTRAAARRNVRILKQMLKKGADVNRCDSDGKTPLILAVENKHDQTMGKTEADGDQNCTCEAVNLLIQAGANVNKYYNFKRITPLWLAVKYNCVQCVSLLMEAGADVNTKCVQENLLCLASLEGHDQCLNLLIQAMGDVKAQCEKPLMLALENDHVECASVLIEAGADVNHKYYYYGTVLGCPRSLAVTRLLLRSGVKINRTWRDIFRAGKPARELLLAAGETRFGHNFSHLLPKAEDLMGMCRDAIRKHLLNLDPHTHLFGRVEWLGLPAVLVRYLVFDKSLDDDNSLKC